MQFLGGAAALMVALYCADARASGKGPVQEYMPLEDSSSPVPAQKGDWVVAPIPVSNPTLGTGLEIVALYLHPKKSRHPQTSPATTEVGGLYTNQGTWFLGMFHKDELWEDRIRILTAAGAGVFELSYFGGAGGSPLNDDPLHFRFDTEILYLQAQARLPGTVYWYIGPTYLFNQADVTFDLDQLAEGLPAVGPNLRTAGVGVALTYDSSDDEYYPRSGTRAEVHWTDYGRAWGGDFEYRKFGGNLYRYFEVRSDLVAALAADFTGSTGTVPFYDLPNPEVRGYERGRYSSQYVFSLRAEARYKFRPRWGVIGFVDTGWANRTFGGLLSGETATSAGAGLRWQPQANQTLHLGLDAAVTNEGLVVFVQLGERF